MEFDDGTSGWVPAHNVSAARADGGKIAPRVRMKVDLGNGPIVRDFHGARVPFNWQDKGEVMAPDDSTQNTPFLQAEGNALRSATAGTIRGAGQVAPAMIPGVGSGPAALRFIAGTGENALADMTARGVEGAPQNPAGSLAYGGFNALLNVPFEALSAMLPQHAPGMMSDAMRPPKVTQRKAQKVVGRQSGTPAAPDYERLGQQALGEGVRPTRKGEGAATLESKMQADNATVEDILDEASKKGWSVTAPQLARSPEVREVFRQIRMEGDPKESLAIAKRWLRNFMEARLASRGVPSRPTGVLNSRGQMTHTQATPAVSRKMSATGLNEEKVVWRRESSPVLKARDSGTPVGPQQSIEARLTDAVARAAKSRLDAIKLTRPDPENARRVIGVKESNARIERRKPLKEALEDFQTRPAPTRLEQLSRMLHGHLLSPETEGLLAQIIHDPRFATQMRHTARPALIGMFGRGNVNQ